MSKRELPTNCLLKDLSAAENRRVLVNSKQIKLGYGDILCEPGDKLRHVYFVNKGLISLLTSVGNTTVEVGLVGREGMAGMSLLLGVSISPVRMLVQGEGTATQMTTAAFLNAVKRNPGLRRGLNQYLYMFMAQITQTAACNTQHILVTRLARWLLMTHDRSESNEFLLTQEFLAHMLGVRRVGVSAAAAKLQQKKLISYKRGTIAILNRKGLERAACRCYKDVNEIRTKMLANV